MAYQILLLNYNRYELLEYEYCPIRTFLLRTLDLTNIIEYELLEYESCPIRTFLLRTLDVTIIIKYELYPVRISEYELLFTNHLQCELSPSQTFAYEPFAYELYSLQIFQIRSLFYNFFTLRTFPLRFFFHTNICFSHTNICIRIFAYEHFPVRTLCLRIFVRLPCFSRQVDSKHVPADPVKSISNCIVCRV